MTLVCYMVIGWFDPAQRYEPEILIERPLDPETVGRLQAACDQLFSLKLRLADHLTERGVLFIKDGSITLEMFKVACAAHELFGMTAVDQTHHTVIYPNSSRPPNSLDALVGSYRKFRPDWDEARARQAAGPVWEQLLRRRDLEHEVIESVLAAKGQRGQGNG